MKTIILLLTFFLTSISSLRAQDLKSISTNDSLTSIEKMYDSVNVLRVVKLVDKKSGDSTMEFYNKNGKLTSKVISNKTVKEKRTITYYPNGNIKENLLLRLKGYPIDSDTFKVTREWILYHENGKIAAELIYENGVEIKTVFYNSKGESITRDEFYKICKFRRALTTDN